MDNAYCNLVTGFTKLFASIIHSTVWREDLHVKVVWITMLAMADQGGRVFASIPGLADASRVTLDQCLDALAKLSAPDPYSRTKTHEGRRIREIDGGWEILNYLKHREQRAVEERRIQTRLAVARHRAKAKAEHVSTALTVSNVSQGKPKQKQSTEAEAEEESPLSKNERGSPPRVLAGPPRLKPKALQALWNAKHPPLPACHELSDARLRACGARLRAKPDPAYWADVIARIAASAFCRGENDRGWVATFDWLLRPDTATKVLEGKYDTRVRLVGASSKTAGNVDNLKAWLAAEEK